MSRPIKFRAWDKQERNMYFLGTLFDLCYTEQFAENWGGDFDRYEIMQATGLMDKNGKDVYEGDILKDTRDGDADVVVWRDDYPSFQVMGAQEPWASPLNKYFLSARCEVIGNIYENQELSR